MFLERLPKQKPESTTVSFRIPRYLLNDVQSFTREYGWTMTEVVKIAFEGFVSEVKTKGHKLKQTDFQFGK